jgi:putative transcriptional regulator
VRQLGRVVTGDPSFEHLAFETAGDVEQEDERGFCPGRQVGFLDQRPGRERLAEQHSAIFSHAAALGIRDRRLVGLGCFRADAPAAAECDHAGVADVIHGGRLLVATPVLLDPNFARTVVLVVQHGDDGSLGVVLNRPTGADPRAPLPAWSDLIGDPPVVFVGGPVQPGVAVGLARASGPVEHPGWLPVIGHVGLVDLSLDPSDYGDRITEVRVFAGYAGWAADQLEVEVDEPAWFVIDGDEHDPFTEQPEDLWRVVLRRQRGSLALYATYPIDVSAN